MDNFGKFTDLSLHAIDPLNNDEDFLPRAMRSWLSLNDRFAQNPFKIFGVVVTKGNHFSSRIATSSYDGVVVEGIGDDERTLSTTNDRKSGRVCSKSHPNDHGGRFSDILGDGMFKFLNDFVVSTFISRSSTCIGIVVDGFYYVINNWTRILSEPEIIVRAEI